MKFAKRPGPRTLLAGHAREAARAFESLAVYLTEPAPKAAAQTPYAAARHSTAPTALRLDRVLRELAREAERLQREAMVFNPGPLPLAGGAALKIALALSAVAEALESTEGAAEFSLKAKREASAAEKRARDAMAVTLAADGPAALKARSVIKGLSEAADLAERAADLAGELALED